MPAKDAEDRLTVNWAEWRKGYSYSVGLPFNTLVYQLEQVWRQLWVGKLGLLHARGEVAGFWTPVSGEESAQGGRDRASCNTSPVIPTDPGA